MSFTRLLAFDNMNTMTCATCGKPVAEINGTKYHEGGGHVEQKCGCGWSGGQLGKFSVCPRCGQTATLVDSHSAN